MFNIHVYLLKYDLHQCIGIIVIFFFIELLTIFKHKMNLTYELILCWITMTIYFCVQSFHVKNTNEIWNSFVILLDIIIAMNHLNGE